ncbi:unnamed protein product [Didymodactylos carnosus]|uniref:Uncharacterized protein n=1 Tax=Didymodactylos carnosus TaxID=1234261 RepID=A0A8S2INL2_9BILA|nr:unnamed protein product [Didymodactylos carnosus]CAF3759703.1 unnamed protein product [Didymodactylos carnosus]
MFTNKITKTNKIKVLWCGLIVTTIAFFTFLITLCSSSWITITYPKGFYAVHRQMYVRKSNYGIIWECVLGKKTEGSMDVSKCYYHGTFMNEGEEPNEPYEPYVDRTLLALIKTMTSFSIIVALLLMLTFVCGLYSIREFRYMYKRLTGSLYILAAAALLVCMEVLNNVIRHGKENLPGFYPKDARHSYNICYVLSWMVFIILITMAFVFFACSKKLKGTFDSATEEEGECNRPVLLGR